MCIHFVSLALFYVVMFAWGRFGGNPQQQQFDLKEESRPRRDCEFTACNNMHSGIFSFATSVCPQRESFKSQSFCDTRAQVEFDRPGRTGGVEGGPRGDGGPRLGLSYKTSRSQAGIRLASLLPLEASLIR